MPRKNRLSLYKTKFRYFVRSPIATLLLFFLTPVALYAIVLALESYVLIGMPIKTSFSDRMGAIGVLVGMAVPFSIIVIERLAFFKDNISISSVLGFTRIIPLFELIAVTFVLLILCDSGRFLNFISILGAALIIASYFRIISLIVNAKNFIDYRHKLLKSTLLKFVTKKQHGDTISTLEDFVVCRAEEAKQSIKGHNQARLASAMSEIQYFLCEYVVFSARYIPIDLGKLEAEDQSGRQVGLIVANAVSSIISEIEESDTSQPELLGTAYSSIQSIIETATAGEQIALASLLNDEKIRIYEMIMRKSAQAIIHKPISGLANQIVQHSISQAESLVEAIIQNKNKKTTDNSRVLLCQGILKELFVLAKHHRYNDFIKVLAIIITLSEHNIEDNIFTLEVATTLAFADLGTIDKKNKIVLARAHRALFGGISPSQLRKFIQTDCGTLVANLKLEFIKNINGEVIENEDSLLGRHETSRIVSFAAHPIKIRCSSTSSS